MNFWSLKMLNATFSVIFKHCAFFETCSRASFMEVLLQEWQEIGVAPFPPRSRFNGQGSKALQEYEKCIKRGVEPGSSAPL